MESAAKTALVPLADGAEEIEAVCIIDTLRRAEIDVTVAGVETEQVRASRGVQLVADTTVSACRDRHFDLIALPGGMPGAENLAACGPLKTLLCEQHAAGRLIGAICAAPAVVLQPWGLLAGLRVTCYPSFQDRLDPARVSTDPVVCDGPLVTAQGPAWAIDFSLTLIEQLLGSTSRDRVGAAMLAPARG